MTVELRPDAEGARIVVRDTGVGIDASELPHIFDRFYRGTMANEARGSGSGLGLAIVKSIVDLHAGRVDRRQPARRRDDVHGHPAQGPAGRERGAARGEPERDGDRATGRGDRSGPR